MSTRYVWNKYNRNSRYVNNDARYYGIDVDSKYDEVFSIEETDPSPMSTNGRYQVTLKRILSVLQAYKGDTDRCIVRVDKDKNYKAGDVIQVNTVYKLQSSSHYWKYKNSAEIVPSLNSTGTNETYCWRRTASLEYSQGSTLQGTVSSADSGAYPNNGYSGSNWYVYQGADTIDPAAVSLPASIFGGDTVTVTVTPSAGKVYGGTVSYTWQYRLDGGAWQSLGSGAGTTQQLTVPAGTNTVEVQARANDDLGFTSSTWVSSGAVNVTNNLAPTAPGSITVSAAVAGEPLTVTLTAATDPDGTVAAYIIERRVDGGSWQQVSSGPGLTYTDTVGADWQSVQYRAAAIDNEGAQGPYIESEVLSVSTGAVTITGPASGQGEHAQPFDIPLTLGVTPAPSDPAVQFAVLLDGAEAVSASHAAGDQITLHIDPRVMARGAHTITVTASKEAYSTAMAQYTYTVPAWDGSDIEGGASGVMQDHTGRKLLPRTLAQDCLGPDGKDVATWIAELSQGGGSAATGLKLETGSYRGNGQFGEESPNTLSFSGTPQLVVVQSYAGTGIFVRGVEGLALRANYYAMAATLIAAWIDNGVSWFGSDAQSQLNVSSTTYRYVALIAPEN